MIHDGREVISSVAFLFTRFIDILLTGHCLFLNGLYNSCLCNATTYLVITCQAIQLNILEYMINLKFLVKTI